MTEEAREEWLSVPPCGDAATGRNDMASEERGSVACRSLCQVGWSDGLHGPMRAPFEQPVKGPQALILPALMPPPLMLPSPPSLPLAARRWRSCETYTKGRTVPPSSLRSSLNTFASDALIAASNRSSKLLSSRSSKLLGTPPLGEGGDDAFAWLISARRRWARSIRASRLSCGIYVPKPGGSVEPERAETVAIGVKQTLTVGLVRLTIACYERKFSSQLSQRENFGKKFSSHLENFGKDFKLSNLPVHASNLASIGLTEYDHRTSRSVHSRPC